MKYKNLSQNNVLKLFSLLGRTGAAIDYLYIRNFSNGNAEFFINCNDIFAWACSDCEEVTDENIDVLENAIKDTFEHGEILFCCRVRKMRPQGAYFKYLKEEEKQYFLDAGPPREIDFCNPYNEENKYLYQQENKK